MNRSTLQKRATSFQQKMYGGFQRLYSDTKETEHAKRIPLPVYNVLFTGIKGLSTYGHP